MSAKRVRPKPAHHEPPSVTQRWDREELGRRYQEIHGRLSLLTELAIFLRGDLSRGTAAKFDLMARALHAVDNRSAEWWAQKYRGEEPTLAAWIRILEAEPALDDFAALMGAGEAMT